MTPYEKLEDLANREGVVLNYSLIKEWDTLQGLYIDFGRTYPKVILLNRYITSAERLAVLAEELGHHFASYGNIVAMREVTQRKQEAYGRAWAYEHLIPPGEIFTACLDGEGSIWELAERLGLPEGFIRDALEYYARKYGDFDIAQVRFHGWMKSA